MYAVTAAVSVGAAAADAPFCGASSVESSFAKAGWTAYIFPRGKHRPQVFHSGELTVSPASIDLCGIFVVPLEKDFTKISAEDIAAIFREVTLPDDQFEEIVEQLEAT